MWLKGKPVLRAAQAGWTVMGRFWSAECSQRVKRKIFRSMVWSTFLPSRADCRAFDKFTACKGRSLMRRKASGRWIDAEGKKEIPHTYNGRSLEMAEISSPTDSPPTLVAEHSPGSGRQRGSPGHLFWQIGSGS